MKTIPLWKALTGAPYIENARDDVPILGAKFCKVVFPTGKQKIAIPCTREAADAIQKALTLPVIEGLGSNGQ